MTSRLRRLVEDVEHFQHRVIYGALQEATAAYWRRRAAAFRQVGTPDCDEVAVACDHRAELALVGGDWPEIEAAIDDVLSEVAL